MTENKWDDEGSCRRAMVYCREIGGFVYVDDVEFRNIEEDMQGRDTMTFKCSCGKEHTSLVVS